MATTITDDRTAELERKVDALSEQVAFLVEEARAARIRREGWEDLQATIMPIGAKVLGDVAAELDEAGITADQVVSLLRRLAANIDTMDAAVAQLESAAQLVEVLSPISAQAMDLATDGLQTLDERGYFSFAKAGLEVVDRVVTGFTEEDVEALGDNVVLILNTVKEMTQPEIMAIIYRMLERIHQQQEQLASEPEEPPSMWELLKLMRDPEVRRGLRRALSTLKAVSTVDTGPPRKFVPGTEAFPEPDAKDDQERDDAGGA